ncbi:hypothetical protein K4K49_007771 [Colletotrichum sp. SAR 10_70]|nr:hypothetical protein K4K50_006057 [Colletotrichum sp. SAR 10_71]KAI8158860.1 hypothetical protein K4K49_007771 [Colletotrichum sp. SAR 10_70]KAI8225871.1 hypothetical protein K4K54_004209 [Colletotrichum sp. SAR 10_86]KAI8256157.1 hypothetical protein K4K53_007360 [Colletotrichum sp. SAR 10_77]KAJ5000441.1 hypothetical protein K4K48_002676 [Colletotrichum sp. SAR 10_66]
MSAVKNLRAMFEQKQDASPPDRGRSPGLSSNGTETPPPPARPLSKIRTSFVAVEKDGRVGLRRDPSNESSLSQRRLSSHTEGEASVSGQSDKTMATEETSGGFKASVVSETIPESPRRPDATKGSPQAATRSLGAVTDKPSHNPDKHVDIETPTPELLPGDPTEKTPSAPTNGTAAAAAADTAKPAAKAKSTAKPAPKSLAPPAAIKARSKTPTRSPTTTKAPALPQSGSKLSAPKAAHDPAKKTPEKPATSTPKTGAKTAGSNKKPAPVNVTPPSGAGFVKPKVKSPTRPVRLPASLMAPTAASVSKVKGEAPRETLSRSSGNQGRPASRASAAGAGPHKTLKRQNSVINRPRPSIGPPPKKPLQDHPITKKEKEVDENFLARMMRPTQSSSSKTTEKAPVTPPRHRSSTQGSGKASSVSRSPRRTIKRSPESVRTGSPFTKKETSIEEVAAETAQVETVEKVAEVVDKAEEPVEVKPEPEPVKAPVTPEPIPEESSSDKTSDPEPSAAVTSGSDGVNEDRPESPEFDELTQRAARLSIDEGDTHELKSPDEFEELLEETVEEQNEAPASSAATTEVKTETA